MIGSFRNGTPAWSFLLLMLAVFCKWSIDSRSSSSSVSTPFPHCLRTRSAVSAFVVPKHGTSRRTRTVELLPSCFGRSTVQQVVVAASVSTSTSALSLSRQQQQDDTNDIDNNNDDDCHEIIVLFGIGDLRTYDHGGIVAAMERQQQRAATATTTTLIRPVVVLDPTTLANIPGALRYTYDTAAMIHYALFDLEGSLKTQFGWKLEVLDSIDDLLPHHNGKTHKGNSLQNRHVHVYVCDLGPADNGMQYGAYSMLQQRHVQTTTTHATTTTTATNNNNNVVHVHVHSWTSRLREEPWKHLETLPQTHADYARLYALQREPILPTKVRIPRQEQQQLEHSDTMATTSALSSSCVPSIDELVDRMRMASSGCVNRQLVESQRNTGLYGTHWGSGVDENGATKQCTVGESHVMEAIRHYCDDDCPQDDKWQSPLAASTTTRARHPSSLEHAALQWMGDKHVLDGEYMTRYLAAPLLLGTISPRHLWHAAAAREKGRQAIFQPSSVLRQVVETQEWHKLLAARNILMDKQYQDDDDNKNGRLKYKYWKWHGFLCRYAEYNAPQAAQAADASKSVDDTDGLLLIHGFGASSSQWTKTMQELVALNATEHILAPDLIGFGQSEKPPLTYTQYLWESYCSAFCQEVAPSWNSFVVGGNSIGGYTSMGVAADDCAAQGQVTASGAPGTNKCAGVVLMNSAGQLKSREEIAAAVKELEGEWKTVAQQTSRDTLSKCNPPPRPVARVFGNGLLWYLRPRIQSICRNLYPTNPDAVNDELCESILRDSLDPGAINVMISGSKLPPPRTANELLGADYGSSSTQQSGGDGEGMFQGPVLVAQGMLDPLNDAKMRAKMFGELRDGITVSPIEAGHCPHDEVPSEVAKAVHTWMRLEQSSRAAADTSMRSSKV